MRSRSNRRAGRFVALRKLAGPRPIALQSPPRSRQLEGKRLFAILQAAGWPIWFLLLASIIAVALIIERAVSLRASRILPPKLFDQVVDLYRRQGTSEDVLERLAKDSPLGAVLAAAL